MSTNHYFHSLKINNYRCLKNLNIEKIRKINLVGGLNGSGKSTLLEAIFLLLDRLNPSALLRPLATRGIQAAYPDGLNYIFGDEGIEKPITFIANTRNKKIELTLVREKLPDTINISSTGSSTQLNQGTPTTIHPEQIGIHIKTSIDNKEEEAAYAIQIGQDMINFHQYKSGKIQNVPGVFLSSSLNISPIENANRFSELVRSDQIKNVIDDLKFIDKDLIELNILQEGNQPTLYAKMKDGKLMQTNMIGGGFQTILSIILLMKVTKNGVILFDEIDATIHYSKLNEFWKLIFRLATENHCQLFVATHSKEFIISAVNSAKENNCLADLQYLRLDNEAEETVCVTYTGEELTDAIESKWEIR